MTPRASKNGSPSLCQQAMNQNFLCEFDFTSLEELDPALLGGWSLVYCREIPGEIRLSKPASNDSLHEIGTIEPLTMKVLIRGTECQPEEVKVEMTSENELFLHYVHKVNADEYKNLGSSQHLLVGLHDYPNVLMKMGNLCIEAPQQYVAIVVLQDNGLADLSFIQNVEYKFVELLRLPLRQSSEEALRQSIQYRYQGLRTRLAALHARLQDVGSIIQTRNPQMVDEVAKCVNVLTNACPPQICCGRKF